MDYINIGAIGFAQLGSDDYYNTRQIEKKVTQEFLKTEQFNIPEELQGMCHFGIKRFPYEYDSYEEVVLHYDDDLLDDWHTEYEEAVERCEIENANVNPDDIVLPVNKCDAFWKFANKSESIDFETEELMQKCKAAYAVEMRMKLVHKKEEDVSPEDVKLKKI